MDKEELEEQIDIILEDEIRKRKSNKYVKSYSLKPKTGQRKTITTAEVRYIEDIRHNGKIIENPENYAVKYPNLELLLELEDIISHSPELRDYFIDYLGGYSGNKDALSLLSEFFIKMNRFDEVNGMIGHLYALRQKDLNPIFETFDDLLMYEYQIFSNEQLKTLRESLKYIKKFEIVEILLERIHNIRYKSLEKHLHEGTDFQIRLDRDKIKEKIITFGFDPILSEALDKIEDMYWDTTKDDFDNSMAIGQLRTFLQDIIKSICKKIEEKSGEKIPKTSENKSEMGKLRSYMKKHLSLDEEDKLINIIVDIFNQKGSHNFISEREYFRLTKNFTTEITYLLFVKLGKFLE